MYDMPMYGARVPQADAEALLTCYGVGEDIPSAPPPPGAEGTTAGAAGGSGGVSPMGSGYGSDNEVYGSVGGGGGVGSVRGHSVVELSFTSSVRFLQPGLLLQVGKEMGGTREAPPPSLAHHVPRQCCKVCCSPLLLVVLLGTAAIP